MVGPSAGVRPGPRQIKRIEDAGAKPASRPASSEDAEVRRYGASSGRAAVGGPTISPAVAVLDLAGGDLLEGGLEGVLRLGVHHRGRILVEGPLTEVVVVRVDLTRALGSDDHARVVRVDAVQQLVQAGLDHSCAPSGDCRPITLAASATSFSVARSRSSF